MRRGSADGRLGSSWRARRARRAARVVMTDGAHTLVGHCDVGRDASGGSSSRACGCHARRKRTEEEAVHRCMQAGLISAICSLRFRCICFTDRSRVLADPMRNAKRKNAILSHISVKQLNSDGNAKAGLESTMESERQIKAKKKHENNNDQPE